MKRFFSSIRSALLPVSAILVVSVLVAACSKFDNDDNGADTPVSGLMAFNLVPDKSAIGITIGGNNLTNAPLVYTNFTGVYQRIFSGNRELESFDVNSDSSLAKTAGNFEVNKYYSVFVVGANGSYSNLVTHDNFDSLSSSTGKAYLRYINAIPDSTQPTVTINAGNNNVVSKPAAFTAISEFVAVDPGQVTVTVNNNSNINANRSIELQQGKVYTILLIGLAGSTDTDKAVQIKYIENGSLGSEQ